MKIGYFATIILLFSIALAGCEVGTNAYPPTDDLIFIPDAYYPQLPAYSEKGYNTFGAIFERSYFVVDRNVVPLKILYRNNNLEISLNGVRKTGSSYYYDDQITGMSMTFTFPFEECLSYEDLIKLHNMPIDLTGAGCKVALSIENDSITKELDVVEGQFFVRRAQTFVIDEVKEAIILSGVFYIKYKENDKYYLIKNGRFDLSVDDLYFNYVGS